MKDHYNQEAIRRGNIKILTLLEGINVDFV
jgi:hypothetical protein